MIATMQTQKKTGDEPFTGMPHTLREYWAWAHSDIASNAERGKLAEYIVHCAVKSPSPFRTEWDAFDVLSEEGIKIEVKCSAYLQTWTQRQFSNIQFDIAPRKAWDAKTNLYAENKRRSADVYVFCLFACQDAEHADPLDLSQWEFYVLGTQVLNDRVPHQKKIGLKSLLHLGARKSDFAALHGAVMISAGQSEARPPRGAED